MLFLIEKTDIEFRQKAEKAYNDLIFFLKSNKRKIVFFAFLGLTGSFLAKGMNGPFGEAYAFLFKYFPGFVMFRDPTKWYLLVILSYSILIPFVLSQIVQLIRNNQKMADWSGEKNYLC